MEVFTDENGYLIKTRKRVKSNREISITKWNGDLYLHLSDTSKCFDTGTFDMTKTKSASIRYKDMMDVLAAIEPHAQQMISDQQPSTRSTITVRSSASTQASTHGRTPPTHHLPVSVTTAIHGRTPPTHHLPVSVTTAPTQPSTRSTITMRSSASTQASTHGRTPPTHHLPVSVTTAIHGRTPPTHHLPVYITTAPTQLGTRSTITVRSSASTQAPTHSPRLSSRQLTPPTRRMTPPTRRLTPPTHRLTTPTHLPYTVGDDDLEEAVIGVGSGGAVTTSGLVVVLLLYCRMRMRMRRRHHQLLNTSTPFSSPTNTPFSSPTSTTTFIPLETLHMSSSEPSLLHAAADATETRQPITRSQTRRQLMMPHPIQIV